MSMIMAFFWVMHTAMIVSS